MTTRFLSLALLLAATPLAAQTAAAPTPPTATAAADVAPAPPAAPAPIPVAEAPKPATVKVSIITTEGPILLELEKERAPITTANFLHYVDSKRFDGARFYRTLPVPGMPEMGIVQGGLYPDGSRMFPPIAHESTLKTGLAHTNGTISMGRGAPGTATSDFFIIVGDMPYMDADPTKPGDNAGYAAFGHVVDGMDVVKRLLAAPRSPTAGEGPFKGQMLAVPVKIISATRVGGPPPAAKPAVAKPAAAKKKR